MTPRSQKRVIFTKHFIEKALVKGVFDDCGFEKGKKITEDAIKFFGILVPEKKNNEYKCIFPLPNEKLVTVPLADENDNLIAKTIFPSQQPDIDGYKKAIKNLKHEE